MNQSSEHEQVVLKGRVAEVVDARSSTLMKLLVDSFYLTVDNELDLHLGDKVELDVRLSVHSIARGLPEPLDRSA